MVGNKWDWLIKAIRTLGYIIGTLWFVAICILGIVGAIGQVIGYLGGFLLVAAIVVPPVVIIGGIQRIYERRRGKQTVRRYLVDGKQKYLISIDQPDGKYRRQ